MQTTGPIARGAMFACFVAALTGCAAAEMHGRGRAELRCEPPVLLAVRQAPLLGTVCGGARFWTDGSTGRSWQQARAMCQSLGGELASIHNEAERVCANQVLVLANVPPLGAWMGFAEAEQEGAWRWSDGSAGDFASWLPGEPNNDSGGPHDCAHLWREQSFAWNDIPCTRADLSFLCRL